MGKIEFKKVGDIVEIEGKKCVVTYVSGSNFSYAPYKETETKPVEEVIKEALTEEVERPKRKYTKRKK